MIRWVAFSAWSFHRVPGWTFETSSVAGLHCVRAAFFLGGSMLRHHWLSKILLTKTQLIHCYQNNHFHRQLVPHVSLPLPGFLSHSFSAFSQQTAPNAKTTDHSCARKTALVPGPVLKTPSNSQNIVPALKLQGQFEVKLLGMTNGTTFVDPAENQAVEWTLIGKHCWTFNLNLLHRDCSY